MSEHYSIEAWTDFARGLDPSGQRAGMQAHLDSGCASCRRRVQLLESAWAASRQETLNEPPAWAVERAKAIFPSAAPRTASEWIGLVGELCFDSWMTPAAAGFRSGGGGPRQLRYRAADLEVELQFEQLPGQRLLQVVGQISAAAGEKPIAGAAVHWLTPGNPGSTECNEFGEFQFEIRAVSIVSLRFDLPDRMQSIELAIPV